VAVVYYVNNISSCSFAKAIKLFLLRKMVCFSNEVGDISGSKTPKESNREYGGGGPEGDF